MFSQWRVLLIVVSPFLINREHFLAVLNKGQVMSNYFRILNRTGGYSWMQSCATLICNTKNADEQSIICVNYVLR